VRFVVQSGAEYTLRDSIYKTRVKCVPMFVGQTKRCYSIPRQVVNVPLCVVIVNIFEVDRQLSVMARRS
jgi:hypothetical protein